MMMLTKEAAACLSHAHWTERATRYEPSRHEASLSWGESKSGPEADRPRPWREIESGERSLFALLLDVSQTGAAVALDRVPRVEDGVWFRVEADGQADWTEAEVVSVTTTAHGPHLVRLAFRDPLPVETLVAAVCG